MEFDVITVYYTLGIIGGLYGIFSITHKIWKYFKNKVKIFYSYGNYRVNPVDENGLSDVYVTAKLGITNKRNEMVSLTDVIGTLRYNKEKYVEHGLNTKSTRAFSVLPTSTNPKLPILLKPNETKEIIIEFSVNKVHLPSIDRVGIARLLGWIEGVPMLIAYEEELKNNWNNMPLLMCISIHIDGKKIEQSYAALKLETGSRCFESKTLSVVDISKIENEFVKR